MKKQEMTRIWKNNTFVPVTLVTVLPQEVVRMKSLEKDGYKAVVVGSGKKELPHRTKGTKVVWQNLVEFKTEQDFSVGTPLTTALLEGYQEVIIEGTSKGKGFQGVMKRHNFAGGPATHGSKFHRVGGSTGNRKPRRTHKGHPMAGQMGGDQITLKKIGIVDMFVHEGQHIVALKGSIPGAYNGVFKIRLV